jgi:hypothetical protein
MSSSAIPPLRQEVGTYLRSCEELLSMAVVCGHSPFTRHELQIMNYCAGELTRLVSQHAKM